MRDLTPHDDALARTARFIAHVHQVERGEDGAQGIAQFVAKHRQERILGHACLARLGQGILERGQQARTLVLMGGALPGRCHQGLAHEPDFLDARRDGLHALAAAQRRRAGLHAFDAAHDAPRQHGGQRNAGRQHHPGADHVDGKALDERHAEAGARRADRHHPAIARRGRIGADHGIAFERIDEAHAFRAGLHQAPQRLARRADDRALLVARARHDRCRTIEHGDHRIGRYFLARDHVQETVRLDHRRQYPDLAIRPTHRHPHRHGQGAALPARHRADDRPAFAQRLGQAGRFGHARSRRAVRRHRAKHGLAVGIGQDHPEPVGPAQAHGSGVKTGQVAVGELRTLGHPAQGRDSGIEFGVDGTRERACVAEQQSLLFLLQVAPGAVDGPYAQQHERQQADRGQQDQKVSEGEDRPGSIAHGKDNRM